MPLIPATAALLVVLTRPAAAEGAPRQDTQQATPKDPTQKKKEEKAPKKPKTEYPFFRLDDHPSIHFGKGSHLDFRARFAADATDSEAPTDDPLETSNVDLGKKRIGVSGEIKNAVEFQVEAELSNDDPWRDVYADFKKFDAVRVRGGKFKLPFSLDENTGASKLDFMFRSLAATHLAPGRDRGVMVHGKLLKKVLGYEAGVFEHDGKNARTNNPEKVFGGQTLAGRVTVEPLVNRKNAIGDLSLGAAFTQSDVPEGIAGLRGQTVLDQTFFSSSEYRVDGPRRRLGIEMQFRPGPASIKAEWMRVETQRRGESVEDGDLSPLIGEGWYVSGTYAITGEKKSSVDRPKKPLFPGLGYGAIELAARIENLTFRSGASGEPGSTSPRADVILGNGDQVTTFGVNWYVNRWFKIQANFIRETLDDPSQGPLPSKPSFSSTAIRFQFSM
jgi:phosphate-selective porin OprO/OprP